MFLDFLGKQACSLLSCFSRQDYKCLEAAFKMYEQQKMMFEQNVRSCDRIISIYQPHLRPIVGALCLVFAKTGLETLKKRALSTIDDLVGVLSSPQVSWGKIN